jgi:hypothetical protein
VHDTVTEYYSTTRKNEKETTLLNQMANLRWLISYKQSISRMLTCKFIHEQMNKKLPITSSSRLFIIPFMLTSKTNNLLILYPTTQLYGRLQ